jgi:hypothetical protein
MVNIQLQTGTWKIYGNSEKTHLVIKSVDSSGKITGTAFGHEIQEYLMNLLEKFNFQ